MRAHCGRGVGCPRGVGALAAVVLLWWLATWGAEPEARFISPVILPSPREVLTSFPSLLNERALVQGIAATLKRVLIGFLLPACALLCLYVLELRAAPKPAHKPRGTSAHRGQK